MKSILNSVTVLAMIILSISCSNGNDVNGDDYVDGNIYNFIDVVYVINESSHQIYMSDVDAGKYHDTDVPFYPECISLDSSDSAVEDSNVWNNVYSYWDDASEFYTPSYMTVTIDGIYSYNLYSYAGSARCKCSSCSCKCGEDTAGESDYCCMCSADVINPCKIKNWTLVSVNGVENTDNAILANKDGETVCVWNFIITEEMVEQTLSLLAEVREQI